LRKVVVSRQPLEFTWRNSELIHGDLLDTVATLKADAGIRGILIPGSISVVQQLLAARLVDELCLLVHPVAARKGRRLVDDGDAPYHLTVTATEAFPTGVIRVIYSPTEAPTKVGYDEVKDQARWKLAAYEGLDGSWRYSAWGIRQRSMRIDRWCGCPVLPRRRRFAGAPASGR